MSYDYGGRENEVLYKKSLIKKAVILASIILAGFCFVYIALSAYRFANGANNSQDSSDSIPLIKAPQRQTKIIPRDSGGLKVKHMDKVVYENIIGKRSDSLKGDKVKILDFPKKVKDVLGGARNNKNRPVGQSKKSDSDILNGIIPLNKPADSARGGSGGGAGVGAGIISGGGKSGSYAARYSARSNSGAISTKIDARILGNSALARNISAGKDIKPGQRVQIAALTSYSNAEKYWQNISSRYERLFRGRVHFIEAADLGKKGLFYRLQIGVFKDRQEAVSFCGRFIAQTGRRKIDCIVVKQR